MNDKTILFFLALCVFALACAVIYQQIVFRTGIQRKLRALSEKLKEILDRDSDEGIMVFTDNQELMELAAQINRLLEDRRKTRAGFRRLEISSKKMLSNISHDIKTPMTVVLGYLEILRLNGTNTEEMLQKAEQKARDVMTLINEFFTLAKLEAGDMEPELSCIKLNELCRETVLSYYELLTEKKFEVCVDIPDSPVLAFCNREALQRILNNLISNAVRYGSDGRYLGLALRETDQNIFLDITDRGRGIEKAFAGHVFDRLFTMEDSRSRQVQGNGLGLTIAKNLALQMGGDLTLESVPHVRTVFTVRLQKMPF